MIYPPGFRWSVDMKPAVGTDLCMHAHVGFLVSGEIHIEYADGCVIEHRAPQIVAIEPGHDGWVVGSEPVVLVEFDFESDTVSAPRHAGRPSSFARQEQPIAAARASRWRTPSRRIVRTGATSAATRAAHRLARRDHDGNARARPAAARGKSVYGVVWYQ